MILRALHVWLPAALAVTGIVAGLDPADRAAGLAEIAQAERDFARLCVEKGVAASFAANFAPEGIGFNPQPVKVREDMQKRPPLDLSKPRAVLNWHPVLSDLAASGEMGFNLGPSLVTPAPGSTEKPRHGYFFSVWQRQADGKFKVMLDIGSDTDGPLPNDTAQNWRALKIARWSAPAGLSIAKEIAALRQQEVAFGDAIATGGAPAAYTDRLGTDFRVFENSIRPLLDKASVAAHLKSIGARANRRFEPRTVDVARSGDFGYAWGAYRTTAPTVEEGHYAHVWRRDASGKWRLVVEVLRPTPPPKA